MATEDGGNTVSPVLDQDSGDPFMNAVKGKYKISESRSAAAYWNPEDGIPRPDCDLTILKWLSTFPITGLLGLDHFYLRSPITGITKLVTGGGLGLWYLWDVCQIWLETDRVLNYGLSTPFDLQLGIAQGMITDKPTNYTSDSYFSLWIFGIILGFIGLDSAALKNWGNTLLKALLFSLFVWSMIVVVQIGQTGFTIGWLFSLFFILYAFSPVIAQYVSVLLKVFGPADIFETGISFKGKEYDSYYGIMKYFIDILPMTAAEKEKIMFDLTYNVSGAELEKNFEIKHGGSTSDQGDNKYPGNSIISFIIYLVSPIWAVIYGIYKLGLSGVSKLPMGQAAKIASSAIDTTSTLANLASKGAELGVLPVNEAIETKKAEAEAEAVNPIKTKINIGTGPRPINVGQVGGSDPLSDSLSSESQILGAALIALIAGGSLKGLVDYLMQGK